MKLDQILKNALEKPTLVDALSYVAVWENDRAVHEALRNHENKVRTFEGGLWETCFKFLFGEVLKLYPQQPIEKDETIIRFVMKSSDFNEAYENAVRRNGPNLNEIFGKMGQVEIVQGSSSNALSQYLASAVESKPPTHQPEHSAPPPSTPLPKP